jgi:hypothetical protein
LGEQARLVISFTAAPLLESQWPKVAALVQSPRAARRSSRSGEGAAVVLAATSALADHRAPVRTHAFGVAFVPQGIGLVLNLSIGGMPLTARRTSPYEVLGFRADMPIVVDVGQFDYFATTFCEVFEVRHIFFLIIQARAFIKCSIAFVRNGMSCPV